MKIFVPLFLAFTFSSLGYGHLNPPQTIALIPPNNNLENENQIEKLCPKSLPDLQKCKREKLGPRTWGLIAYEKASFDSRTIGRILITGTPGKGLSAQYVPTGKPPLDFPSDSDGTGWGYSCYFEFTVSAVLGDWIQLPKRPFPNPVWINIKKDWPKEGDLEWRPTPQPFNTESVYAVPTLGNIVFTKFSGAEFSYRKENPNDMPCSDEPKEISQQELKESTKPVSVLFDKDGHLLARLTNCRGC